MAVVRCPICPDHPPLPTIADSDLRLCIRCQGEKRVLPLPHPSDHLCPVCRSECPQCNAPTGRDGPMVCRSCRSECRTCGRPVRRDRQDRPPGRPDTGTGERPAEQRYFPATWRAGQCEQCRDAPSGPIETVLAALPSKLLRACGGTAPAAAVHLIHDELHRRTAREIAARIERRWFSRWSHRPLTYDGDGEDWTAYGPDNVAVWLIEPTLCDRDCEDGWTRGAADDPCPYCRPQPHYRPVPDQPSEHARDMAATARAAAQAAQTRTPAGQYVPDRARVTTEEAEQQRRQRVRDDTATGPRTRRRGVPADADDPVRAAALQRARGKPPTSPSPPREADSQ